MDTTHQYTPVVEVGRVGGWEVERVGRWEGVEEAGGGEEMGRGSARIGWEEGW